MKKISFILIGLFVLALSSCQSTKAAKKETLPLDFSQDGGSTLDGYWDLFFQTYDTYYLDQILAYVESEDALTSNINEAYANGLIGDDWIEYLEMEKEGNVFTSEYDMDCISILFLTSDDEELKENMRTLYSFFPQDLLVRNAVKSSAYWSLASNADQHEEVDEYLRKKLPSLSAKTQTTFKDVYDIY